MSIAELEVIELDKTKLTAGRQKRATPRKGGGVSDPVVLIEFVARIENLHADLEKEKSAYMLACKALREDIREVLEEAQEKGLPKKPLRAIVKQRALEKKAAACRDDLEDSDHLSAFDIMKAALGDLADLPLGQAAMGAQH
ncbi:MAG: hypothetical protein Dbin4_03023 [Alphaproteobacteria bacterium]|nr:hypothetical protein [Alphaproteobacteria bacterium]